MPNIPANIAGEFAVAVQLIERARAIDKQRPR
jgi:hypothetical protein